MTSLSPRSFLLVPLLGFFALSNCQLDPQYLPLLLQLEQNIQERNRAPRTSPVQKKEKTPLRPKLSALEPCLNHRWDIGRMFEKQRNWHIIKRKTCPTSNRL